MNPLLLPFMVLASATILPVRPVLAQEKAVICTTEPQAHWMSAAAIAAKAVAAGYPQVRSVAIAGSCYQIEALTARSTHAGIVMNPVTGDVVRAWMSD